MRLSLLILLCFIICAMSINDEDDGIHKRIARQATTKKAATTTKKPASTTKKTATTTKKTATTTKKAATTTKKAATTTKKAATTTKKAATTTKKATTTTGIPFFLIKSTQFTLPILNTGSIPPLLGSGSGSGTGTTKKSGTTIFIPPFLGSGFGSGLGTTNKVSGSDILPGTYVDEMDYNNYGMFYDYDNIDNGNIEQNSALPIISSTTMQPTRTPTNSRPSNRRTWNYFSFQRWFIPRYTYQKRSSRKYFNFMSRPSYYRYFRRN